MTKKHIKLPSRLSIGILYSCIVPRLKRKNDITIINEGLQSVASPRIILSNHPSAVDFAYCTMALKRRFNCVTGREHLINRKTGWLLKRLAVIPKKLFSPDSSAIRMMIAAIKNGNDILLMPEGRLSSCGINGRSPEGLEKLVKKLGVDVVTINIKGAFLARGKWCRVRRQGPIVVNAELAITKEKLSEMSTAEIKQCLEEKLSYDEYEWLNQNPNITYHCKDMAEGLENILYLCPQCYKEFQLTSQNNHFICQHCGLKLEHTNRYQFLKDGNLYKLANIKEWFLWQLSEAKKSLLEGSTIETEVKFEKALPGRKYYTMKDAGLGKCSYDLNGFTYEGYDHGQYVTYHFPVNLLPALPFGCNKDFEVYHDDDYFLFTPLVNQRQVVKWSLYAEAAYEIYLKKVKEEEGI